MKDLKMYTNNVFIEKSCDTCVFNYGNVCAGHGLVNSSKISTYGMPMDKLSELFPDGCNDYKVSIEEYLEFQSV